jgi:hypothetical protein
VGNAIYPKANYGQKSETPLNATDHRSLMAALIQQPWAHGNAALEISPIKNDLSEVGDS